MGQSIVVRTTSTCTPPYLRTNLLNLSQPTESIPLPSHHQGKSQTFLRIYWNPNLWPRPWHESICKTSDAHTVWWSMQGISTCRYKQWIGNGQLNPTIEWIWKDQGKSHIKDCAVSSRTYIPGMYSSWGLFLCYRGTLKSSLLFRSRLHRTSCFGPKADVLMYLCTIDPRSNAEVGLAEGMKIMAVI